MVTHKTKGLQFTRDSSVICAMEAGYIIVTLCAQKKITYYAFWRKSHLTEGSISPGRWWT